MLTLVVLASCNSNSGGRGELTGVKVKTYKQELPFGMVYIPSGSFIMGQVDQDVTLSQFSQNKQVTISAFIWMILRLLTESINNLLIG